MENFTPQNQPQFDVTQLPYAECDNCGDKHFREIFKLKEVSALQSPVGKPAIIPIKIFVCDSCGAVLEKYIPEELR